MIRRTALLFSLIVLGCGWLARGQAQTIAYSEGHKPAADKIISIVGDKIILLSDLQNTLVNQRKQYPNLPPDADCMILEQMMSQNILTLQAEKDSLPVSDDEVEQQLEHRVRYFENMYGSQQKMEQFLGMSIYQIKEKYRKDIKDIMLAQAEQKKIVDAVKITPTEVEQFFKAIPTDSLPFFKSEVEVGQIVINPKPSPDVVEYIKNQLIGMRKEALSGKRSFQTLANLYSKDLATGGKILTVDRTQHNYDPQFVAAAFRLKNGEISPVFKSQFGYHIVQMVSREGNIAKVRHILLIPPTTQVDIARATGKLDTIRTNILAGKYTFGEAASLYSDDDNIQTGTKNTGGMFIMPDGSTFMSMDDLDPGIVLMLDTLKIGHVSVPSVYTPNEHMPEQQSVRIVYLKSRSKPHRESLQEDYSRVQAQALQQKQAKELNDWFEKHASDYYLQVDPKYAQCPSIAGWLKKGKSHD